MAGEVESDSGGVVVSSVGEKLIGSPLERLGHERPVLVLGPTEDASASEAVAETLRARFRIVSAVAAKLVYGEADCGKGR